MCVFVIFLKCQLKLTIKIHNLEFIKFDLTSLFTKTETWKMLLFFKVVIILFFYNFHVYIFCQFTKCNCLDKIFLDRFWHLCWQRRFIIKEMGNFVVIPLCVFFCLSSYFLSPNLIHTLYFILFDFPSSSQQSRLAQ